MRMTVSDRSYRIAVQTACDEKLDTKVTAVSSARAFSTGGAHPRLPWKRNY